MTPTEPLINSNPVMTPMKLGSRIRSLRKQQSLSLDQASEKSGISRSSLFKIEKGKMSPTFDALLKIAKGLGIDISHLFASPNEVIGTGRRSITKAHEGSIYETANYQQVLLSSDVAHKSFIPFRLVVRARALEDFPEWDRHESEDFLYVLSGRVVLYTELYEPLTLDEGDSIYYDGRMGHACISISEENATMLWISSS